MWKVVFDLIWSDSFVPAAPIEGINHDRRKLPGGRVAKCHGFGGLIRVNFLEVWGKFFESVIRVFDVWVILPHAPPQLSNFTPLYRVTKCHRNGRYICVKVLEVWGKILGE